MIIYNTTFHAEDDAAARFIDWLRSEYIPAAVASGHLSSPRLTRILANDGNPGKSYSLQFSADSMEALQDWYSTTGNNLVDALEKEFGQLVAGFSTLMEEVEL